MKFWIAILFVCLHSAVLAQDPRISGPGLAQPDQTVAYRNWDVPSAYLSGGSWSIYGGTITNTYNGGTYTGITVKVPSNAASIRIEFSYIDLGTGITHTYSWETFIRIPLQPGNITSPTGTVSVPVGSRSPAVVATDATGGRGGAYSWERSVNGGTWDSMGVWSRDLPEQVITANTKFRRRFLCDYSGYSEYTQIVEQVYTAEVSFTALPALVAGSISPAAQSVAYSTNGTTLTGTAGSGGACGATVSYQWQESFDSLQFVDIAGATATTYLPASVTEQKYYRRTAICGSYVVYSNVATVKVSPYVSGNPVDENYSRTYTILKPGISTQAQAASAPLTQKQESTSYVDGLGRGLQVVHTGFSASGKDVVLPVVYDDAGRNANVYLSYTTATASGKFKNNPLTEYNTFMNAEYPGEAHFYSRSVFEESPLNRVEKSLAPGNSWGGSNRGVQSLSGNNTLTEDVRIWKITGSEGTVPASSAAYANGLLSKQVDTDEDGKQVIAYTDRSGRLVLKKVQVDDVPTTQHSGWLCTYYVYDDLGQLRFVIPPKAVDILKGNGWSLADTNIVNGLCFKYEYDARRRLILKKVPGAAPVENVYDIRDRLVFTRDGNLKDRQQWFVTFYDQLNRPVETALYASNATRASLQSQMNTATGNITVNANIQAPVDLVVSTRSTDITTYAAKSIIIMAPGFESVANDEFIAEIDPNLAPSVTSITANNPLPGIPASQLDPLTFTYYDKYDTSAPAFNASFLSSLESGTSAFPELPSAASKLTRGLVTGTKTRLVETGEWITAANYYDKESRLLQSVGNNIKSGMDVLTNRYDFSGKLLSSYLRQQNPLSPQDQVITLLTVNNYDYGGRLVSVEKALNGGARKTVAANEYNEPGQQKKKTLGDNLESLEYEYNVRGWTKGINKNFAASGGTHYFGTSLHYDDGISTGRYNGNISAITWRSKSDLSWRSYDYIYDASGRLKNADFRENSTGSWQKNPNIDFTVSNLLYDANGNITSMHQKGMKNGTSSTIDQLNYTYAATGNQLSRVVDATNDPQTMLGDFKDLNPASTVDYVYDPNGNLVFDHNKNIQSIQYNHLNLPSRIHIRGKGTISYIYDANGLKVQKIVVDSTYSPARKTVTDYAGIAVFTNDSLQFVSHEEGRVRPIQPAGQPRSFVYDYFLKDHLGNIRMVLTEESSTAMYAATMEAERAPVENALFSNIDASRTAKPVGYPQGDPSAQNEFVAKLNGNNPDKRIGPSIVLKVMAGDTIAIGARAFYKSGGVQEGNGKIPVEGMLSSLIRAIGGGQSGGGHGSGSMSEVQPFSDAFLNNDYERLKERDNPEAANPQRPKAYLNFVLFDEQFKLVEENSGVKQVKAEPEQLQALSQEKMVMQKSGFLYVYTSNETPQDVYFDDVVVELSSGPVLEETHYYPFGLAMSGISSKAPNRLENKNAKFQGQPLDDEFDLNWYGFKYRNHDPQIGRFIEIDPLSNKYVHNSTYAFSENHVTVHVELEGLEKFSIQNLKDQLWRSTGISKSYTPKEFAQDMGKAAKNPENYKRAGLMVGQFTVLTLVGIATEGTGSGSLFTMGTRGMRNTFSGTLESGEISFAARTSIRTTVAEETGGAMASVETATTGLGNVEATSTTTTLTKYWPENGGALGEWNSEFLMPGTEIDRFGSVYGKYFSPRNTPKSMRALPPDNTGVPNAYKVMKPFEVQSSVIAPAFNQIGLGTQYLSPVNVSTLLKRGIIAPIQ
ncbi:DUF6443 domain-containing protein [Chitinophaga sp. YIM B06452]|uniref:DUF6443 domain-containing protein n=1 Tax=Chitinophaga sp. YIM B06452 TaxID=3082158 RepID=UPI0031FEA779